jgi:hypothetical protein
MFMIFHAMMADVKTDEFVLGPEISDISDGSKEKECEFCINLKKN